VFGILWALPELGQCGDWEKLIVKTENINSHQVSVAHMDIVDCCAVETLDIYMKLT
jgi:hypothetical protein